MQVGPTPKHVLANDIILRKHDCFPLADGSAEVKVVKDGEPEMGMGYPGTYKVKTTDVEGKESQVTLKQIAGLMLVGKGWPPNFIECLDTPQESKVIVGGELGGLIEFIEEREELVKRFANPRVSSHVPRDGVADSRLTRSHKVPVPTSSGDAVRFRHDGALDIDF